VTDYEIDDRCWIHDRVGNFSLHHASRPAVKSTQPPIQWVRGTLSLGVTCPGREAGHSLPSSTETRNAWIYTYSPPVFMTCCLIKHIKIEIVLFSALLNYFGLYKCYETNIFFFFFFPKTDWAQDPIPRLMKLYLSSFLWASYVTSSYD
jgi:hypothetical protein